MHKIIITLTLLLTGVVGTSFASDARTTWAGVAAKLAKESLEYKDEATLRSDARDQYDRSGKLNFDMLASIRLFTKNSDLTNTDAINWLLKIHPHSPEMKKSAGSTSPDLSSSVSPLSLSPRK